MYKIRKLKSTNISGYHQDSYMAYNTDRNLKVDEVKNIYNQFNNKLKRKHNDGEIAIRCLSKIGWRTYKGFLKDDLIIDEEDYLRNGGVSDVNGFVDNFYQMQIVVRY